MMPEHFNIQSHYHMAEKNTAELEKKIEELNAENTRLKEDNGKQADAIKKLTAQLNKKPEAPAKAPIFEVDGKQYKCVVPSFSFNHQIYSASDLSGDKKLQLQLIKIGSGLIEEVEK